MYKSELREIGLSDKEAKVYLAALTLGKSTAQEISSQAGVNRATTYVIIESLKQRGLMSSFEQKEKTFFISESPERLMSLLRKEEQAIIERQGKIKKIMPELLSIYRSADNKPKVKFYEGKEGLCSIKQEYLKMKGKEIYNISDLDTYHSYLPPDKNYTKKRIERGIRAKLIYISKHEPDKRFNSSEKELRETKFIPFSNFPFRSDITIFDDKVSIESYKENAVGILIEDKHIANSMKAIFDFIWKASEEKNPLENSL